MHMRITGELRRFSRLRLYRKIRIAVSRRDIGNPRGNILGDSLCRLDCEIKCSALGDFDESRLKTLPEIFSAKELLRPMVTETNSCIRILWSTPGMFFSFLGSCYTA